MARIGRLDLGDPLLHQLVRGAAIALEGELDVLGGDRVAVVELGALAQHEIVGQAVLGRRPASARLGASGWPGIGFTIASCSA